MKLPPHLSGTSDYAPLRELFRHHIESFDHMLDHGLEAMLLNIKPVEVHDPLTNQTLRNILLPCRQAKLSYLGKLKVEVFFQYGDGVVVKEDRFNFGQFPIMLKLKEVFPVPVWLRIEAVMYFILNGLERVIRLLILPKRNYPMSMERNSFRDRREGYTDKAVVIRCVRKDQSAVTVKLYYLSNGSARLGFWIQGKEYLLPVGVILKALVDTTDHEIYVSLSCCYNETYERVKGSVGTQLVGERVKIILDEVADAVLRDYIFVHLDNNHDKFNLLIFMLQKLFSFIDQTSLPDNPDSLQNQEVLLPGHLITIYMKEKLQEWLLRVKRLLQDEINRKSSNKSSDFGLIELVKKIITDKNPPTQISLAVENMLKTGRLVTQSGLDLQQRAGMTVQAERLNFLRFISHFRAVHRGASFAGLRTTTVRKLLPESWGFICPVHTPDGEPCGLLNHMSSTCRKFVFVAVNSVIYTKAKKSANSLPLPLPLLADPCPPPSPLSAAVAAVPSFPHLSLAADD
ncbi:hypothetical protein RJ639_015928 [Escallonia herrerae]|uniref:DNA-directed RNA polymerase n=1 Tax=Escallonia herrerae TaxID=1293975 RepID=A0AA88VDT7_9ASTE|nr:hypothetical protein RJ639_015928 [Escallonia herrerae]